MAVLLSKSPLVDKYNFYSVRAIFCGAAPLGIDTHKQVETRIKSAKVFQGMTSQAWRSGLTLITDHHNGEGFKCSTELWTSPGVFCFRVWHDGILSSYIDWAFAGREAWIRRLPDSKHRSKGSNLAIHMGSILRNFLIGVSMCSHKKIVLCHLFGWWKATEVGKYNLFPRHAGDRHGHWRGTWTKSKRWTVFSWTTGYVGLHQQQEANRLNNSERMASHR